MEMTFVKHILLSMYLSWIMKKALTKSAQTFLMSNKECHYLYFLLSHTKCNNVYT